MRIYLTFSCTVINCSLKSVVYSPRPLGSEAMGLKQCTRSHTINIMFCEIKLRGEESCSGAMPSIFSYCLHSLHGRKNPLPQTSPVKLDPGNIQGKFQSTEPQKVKKIKQEQSYFWKHTSPTQFRKKKPLLHHSPANVGKKQFKSQIRKSECI